MRKITKTLVLLAAAAMAFASCSKEKETPVPTPEEGTIRVKFAADAALTKVGLTPNDGDTQFSATWDEDDQIEITSFVHGGAMKETVSAEWSSDDKCFTTLFEYEQYAEGLYDFVGVWPVGKDADKLFPAERHQNGSSYNGDYDLMKSSRASAATLTADETIVLDMVRQTSIAYFHITSELNENIVSATLTTDKPIASSNATLDYNGFKPNAETAGETSIKLIIDGEMSSSDFKLWFNVLPVQYETMSLLIETANHSFSLSKKSSGEWKAGELNKVVLTNVPAEKWAEIERPAGETNITLTMTNDAPTTYTSSDEVVTASFDANGGTAFAWNSNEEAVRLYAKGKVTVSVADGYELKSVVFNAIVNANSRGVKPTPKINDVEVAEDDISWSGSAESVVLWADGSAGNISIKTISVTYTDPNSPSEPIYKYSVMVDKNVSNGTVTVDKTSAKEGDLVTITATPSDGYGLVANSLKATNAVTGDELTIADNKFTMPAANVNVTASFYLIPTLSATSPEPYNSNLTNNGGEGYSISVTSNQKWSAAFKDGDLNAAGITLMTSAGEGDGAIVFKFNEKNLSVVEDKTTTITLSAESGSPAPIDLTITHKKLGAAISLSADQNVEASSTSASFQVSSANFEWSVLSATVNNSPVDFKEASDPSAGDYTYTVAPGEDYKATITVNFPSNAAVSETTFDKTIAVIVGMADVKTATHKITQSGETFVDPNARYYELVTEVPAILNGKYILAYGTTAYVGIGDDRLSAADGTIEISEGKILSSDATDALAIDIYGTTDNYYVLFPDGNFLSMTTDNKAIPSKSVYKLTGFTVSDNKVSITGNDGTNDRVLVNNGGKVAFYKTSSASSYILPTLYRLSGSENDVTEFKQFVVSCENEDIAVAAAGGTKTITLTCPNVAWTASQTGGATLSSVSGTGNGTITVTIPENKSETETPKYTVTVATTDTGVPSAFKSKTFTFIQSKKSSQTVKVGDVMWSETWTGAKTGQAAGNDYTPSANYGKGTTVYNDGTVIYSQSANSVYVRNDNNAGGTKPELMISSNQTWTVSGIPTGGAAKVVLTFKSNRTDGTVTCNTSGASTSGTWSNKSVTITTGGASSISLTFNAPSRNNIRIDDIEVKVDTL